MMRSFGTKSRLMCFNVADANAVEEAVTQIHSEFGSIDILVNNAGVALDNLLLRLKDDDFDQQIAINLKGAFNCSKSCIRFMMKNRYGRIINISSVVGEMG